MKDVIYYVAIATVIFSHVKISSFCVRAHLVFHWCLYNKNDYDITKIKSGQGIASTRLNYITERELDVNLFKKY